MIRDFRPPDQHQVRQLVLEGLRERWGDSYDPNVNPDLDDLVTNYIDRGAEVVVIEVAGAIIATGILVPADNVTGQILRMSVRADHRRQGLARQVVEELLRRAHRRGLSEVRVLTDTPWTSAIELYRACGFTEIGSDGTDTHFAMTL